MFTNAAALLDNDKFIVFTNDNVIKKFINNEEFDEKQYIILK